jgi:hypothetical protein
VTSRLGSKGRQNALSNCDPLFHGEQTAAALDSLWGELAEAPFQTSMVIVDDGALKRFRDGEIFLSWSYSNKV